MTVFHVHSQLMRDPDVVFAGYKIPHPLEYVMLVSVQTTPNSNPIKAFRTALLSLQREFLTLKRSFVVCFSSFLPFTQHLFQSLLFWVFKNTTGPTRRQGHARRLISIPLPLSHTSNFLILFSHHPQSSNQKTNLFSCHCEEEEEPVAPLRLRDAREGLAEGGTGG